MKKQTIVIVSVIAMAAVFALGVRWYQADRAEQVSTVAEESSSVLVPDYAMTYGPEDARVEIVEFFDPACETCAVFYPHVKELLATHPGQVRLVMRYAPFHPGSEGVVKILEASRRQGKYWDVLELMFASQRHWASHHNPRPELLWEFLAQTDVDVEQLRTDAGDFTLDAIVQKDLADAATLGIRKTPGFLVNGRPLPSFGLEQLQRLVAEEVAANY